jgi:two-component system sensor histidine kinase SenX3
VVSVTVRLNQSVAIAIAVALGVVVIAVLVMVWRARRAQVRRVVDIALRLEDSPPPTESRRLEKTMGRLERAVDGAVLARGEATVSAGRMSEALRAVTQGVVICDDTGEVLTRNEAAATLEAERYGDGSVAAVVEAMLQRAIEGETQRRTLELFGALRRTLIVSVVPIDDARRTVGGLAIIDDVSERRRLEAVRRDFVANVSHELKTPVGALGLLAETLATERDPAVARRLAQRMVGDAMRLARVIDDLIELSRIEAEQTPVREPVPVHLVVAEAVEQVRTAAEQHGVEVHVAEARHTLTVTGDRRQIVSAIFNLLDNAVKYSEEGSPVDVRVAVDDVADRVSIDVRDQGAGIPTRDHERVFERFYRVDRGRADAPGTGLGLAIVRHVADNLGGEVHLMSREGEGSTFTLVLPAGPPLPAAQIAPTDEGDGEPDEEHDEHDDQASAEPRAG